MNILGYNIVNIDQFQGATKLTKDDIERVFSLYDRVSINMILIWLN